MHGLIDDLRSPAERRKWRQIGRGLGIHCENLDEDISIEGLLSGKPSGERQEYDKKAKGLACTTSACEVFLLRRRNLIRCG